MYEIDTIMFFSESVDTGILTNNIQLVDQHSEDQIHMHDTQILVLIRVQTTVGL